MATTDVKTNSLIVNKLTKAQYDGIANPNDTELYFITDDDAGSSGMTVDTLWSGSSAGGMGMSELSLTLSQNPSNYKFLAIQVNDYNGNYYTFIMLVQGTGPYEILCSRTAEADVFVCIKVRLSGTTFYWTTGKSTSDMTIQYIYGVK